MSPLGASPTTLGTEGFVGHRSASGAPAVLAIPHRDRLGSGGRRARRRCRSRAAARANSFARRPFPLEPPNLARDLITASHYSIVPEQDGGNGPAVSRPLRGAAGFSTGRARHD